MSLLRKLISLQNLLPRLREASAEQGGDFLQITHFQQRPIQGVGGCNN